MTLETEVRINFLLLWSTGVASCQTFWQTSSDTDSSVVTRPIVSRNIGPGVNINARSHGTGQHLLYVLYS